MTNEKWSPSSWKNFPVKQQPTYNDQQQLQNVLEVLKGYPPLVFAGEVEALKKELSDCSKGKKFLLQGGDCAERFIDCNEKNITSKLKILLQMSVVLCYGARKPILRVGRIAGQYGKPRSADMETVNGLSMPVYRGDNVNSFEPNLEQRNPDPQRLLKGYHMSSMTLNYVRALTKGGFADLHHPENWDLSFVKDTKQNQAYNKIVDNIQNSISFMDALGASNNRLDTVEFYTSHEGLILGFEESMTRFVEEYNGYYNLGAHMLWIGDRTRQLDGGHIEYFRGVKNPVGIKVGPFSDPNDICQLVKAINSKNEEGKVVLISRFGHENVKGNIEKYIEAIQSEKLNVVWSCDPMHGNGNKTEDGIKTRRFDHILSELNGTFEAHKANNSILGGVHFELTGENVTECLGGSEGLTESDLRTNYETYCDPRLNYSQSLEMAFLLATLLKDS